LLGGIEFENVSRWIGVAMILRIKAGNVFASIKNVPDACGATQNIKLL